jgi:large repetitive protein
MARSVLNKSSGFTRIALAVITLAALVMPNLAAAYSATGTAANTVISNTVTVTFNNASGTAQTPVTATATITVALVKANPTINAPGDQTIDPNTTAVYNYTITANSNGPDNYTLAVPTVVNSAGITTASTGVLSTTTITNLGSTIVAAAAVAGATAITVPSDGVPDAIPSVNGIVAGNRVLIGAVVYTVSSVTDNASGTSTINLSTGLAAAVALGDSIYEQQTFTLTVTPGTVSATTDQTITTTVTAQYNGSGSTVSDITVTTVRVPNLTVAKAVSTDGATGGVYALTTSSSPGSIVTYRITVTNSGAGVANAVTITDPLSAYIAFNTGTCKVTTNIANTTYASAGLAITDAACGYSAATSTITYTGTPTLAAGASEILFFQVTIR